MRDAYIFDALRSPRGKGRSDGSLNEVTPVKLSADMLNAIKDRNGLDGHAVEDVIWGNATQVKEQGAESSGEIIPVGIEVGQTVLYSKYGGTEVTTGGEDVLVLNARDVLAVVDA